MPPHASEELADRLRPFATCFTAAVWRHVPVLVAGALLAPGRRTVTAALRVMALDRTASFAVYHRVLSTARWSARAVAHRLLLVLVATLVRDGPVVVGIDDTIERRWGARIGARGIYRDPVRSSRGHFVKASGLRWLCLMVMAPMPWGGVRGLPFLTVLAPSERYAHARGRRHKKLTDRARQALLQTARWLPGRRVVAVADSSFSVIGLLRVVGRCLCMVTRLRLDAGLYEPAPARKPGTKGRPRVKGARLPSLAERIGDPTTPWRRVTIAGWYGGGERRLDVASGTAVWHHPGRRAGAASLPVHRPGGRPGHRPRLVRAPLALRDDVRGGAPPPRDGDATAVVGPGHPAHHARPARPVLAGGRLGGRDPGPARPATRCCLLVPEAGADLQRRPRRRQGGTLARGGFRHLTVRPGGHENPRRPPRAPSARRLPAPLTVQSRAECRSWWPSRPR